VTDAGARRELEKRLRELQRAYYANPRDTSIPPRYLEALGARRRLESAARSGPRLHLGAGGHRIDGWINVDIARDGSTDLLAD